MWVGQLPLKLSSVTVLAYAPDGRTLYSGDSKGKVLAWDVSTRTHRALYRRPKTGNRGVYTLWPTPDGARVLCADDDEIVDVLHPDSGPLLRAKKREREWGSDWRYLLPDGRRVMSCEFEWRIGLWDLRTGKRLKVPGALGRATHITHHDLLPDGVTLLTYQAESNELRLWNLKTGKQIGALTPNARAIKPCALARDGATFAVGLDKKLWIYDVPARSLRHQLKFEKDIRELAFHPNGRFLASASTNSVTTFWDVWAGQRVTQFDWNTGKVEALAFAPDGLTCAVGGFEKFVVFDVDA
jgi:WD40 repeat protein